MYSLLKPLLIGTPVSSAELDEQRLTKGVALAVFGDITVIPAQIDVGLGAHRTTPMGRSGAWRGSPGSAIELAYAAPSGWFPRRLGLNSLLTCISEVSR